LSVKIPDLRSRSGANEGRGYELATNRSFDDRTGAQEEIDADFSPTGATVVSSRER
jgi:hypothetical protein